MHRCGSLEAVVYKYPPHHMLVSFLTLDNRTNLFPTPSFRCDYCQLILIDCVCIHLLNIMSMIIMYDDDSSIVLFCPGPSP